MKSTSFDRLIKLLPAMDNTQMERLYMALRSMAEPAISEKGKLIGELRETKFK